MADQYVFEVVVKGKDFHTELISPSDVAKIITSVEKIVRSIVVRDNPALQLEEEALIIGLSSVTQSDLKSTFVTPFRNEVSHAVEITATAVRNENFAPLPYDAIKAVKTIKAFNRVTNTATEIRERNGKVRSLAELTSKTRIRTAAFVMKSNTTMYGTLSRIGGYDPPRAYVQFIDGKKFSCRVKDRQLAKEMADWLYQVVGMRGLAQWDSQNMLLHDFRIEELLPYRATTPSVALEDLKGIIGKHYDQLEDPATYISSGRRDNDDEYA